MPTQIHSFIILSLFMANLSCGQDDESKEPALKYELKIGKSVSIIGDNEAVTVEGNFNNPRVSIKPNEFRVFPYMGVKFSYPRQFVFESDLSDLNSKSWTLTGNNLNVMLFDLAVELSTVEFANSMIGEFGNENARISQPNITAKFGNLELPGTRLEVNVASAKMRMEIMKLPSKSGQTKLLVFQDSLDDDGTHSSEGEQVMRKIKSTFQFTK